jgi:hypothetical protein
MIKLTQTSETFGDCTALYSVQLDKPYTVKEFIDEVLTKEEWGYIGIEDKYGDSIFGNPNCEYKRNELITEMPVEVLDKVIVKVRASGGWTRMDYNITIE